MGEDGSRIHLVWRERGGPPMTAPTHRGFGSTLIERAISTELGEPIQLRFEADSLVCEFDGPIEKGGPDGAVDLG